MNGICQACRKPFTPKRSTARFCSDRCRLAAHRGRAPERAPEPVAVALHASVSVSSTRETHSLPSGVRETLKPSIPSAPKPLPRGIVPDAKWPGMYRIRRPDGSLTDMVNLTRAKDALAEMRGLR